MRRLRVRDMRSFSISYSLARHATLQAAIDSLGLVQADPIRAPARAQDLILRQRVEGYRAGDIESRYPRLDVEEDLLYAYGYVSRAVHGVVHPRSYGGALSDFDAAVLDTVRGLGPTHPNTLAEHFGSRRVVNSWGGYSRATKQSLERLHYLGFLRVARRENGTRVYEAADRPAETLPPTERLSQLALAIARVLAPVPLKTLQAIVARMRRWFAGGVDHRLAVRRLFETDELASGPLDDVVYAWPAGSAVSEEPPQRVRFLAPFDPVVFDRTRFEHLWGWSYRFEAYTPPARRLRGYYAMPMLWRDQFVGWANASWQGDVLDVKLGFCNGRPRDRRFRTEADAEAGRLEAFLAVGGPGDRA